MSDWKEYYRQNQKSNYDAYVHSSATRRDTSIWAPYSVFYSGVTCHSAGYDACDEQENTDTQQVFRICPRDAAIVDTSDRNDLKNIDEITLAPSRLRESQT